MIKLFRNLRYKLLETGKNTRYLKYAIGEILLVMVGILLALQINNWNEHRKDRNKEQVILKQLKEDYQTDLAQLRQKIEMRNIIIGASLKIFKAIDHPEVINRDSLIKNISIAYDCPTFNPIQNDLTSSENLRLIENEQLKRLLSNWSSDVVALTEIEKYWGDYGMQKAESVISKLGISRDGLASWINDKNQQEYWALDENSKAEEIIVGKSRNPATVTEIINDREFEGFIADGIGYHQPANVQSEALVKRINEILELIDSELIEK